MTRTLILSVALILAGLAAPGCQTYVNIPHQQGDWANSDPNGKTTRQVLILAVRAAIDDGEIRGPVKVILPANTDKLTYAYILSQIGGQAVSAEDADLDRATEAVVFAKSVRIRGTEAEVDVARPIGDGIDQLITVYLIWTPLNGWRADRVHPWRGVPIDESAGIDPTKNG